MYSQLKISALGFIQSGYKINYFQNYQSPNLQMSLIYILIL